MDTDLEKRQHNIDHLMKVIEASSKLGVNMVTTFIGRDSSKCIEENLELVKQIWPPILEHAAKLGVRIAIENCPMLFDRSQWPILSTSCIRNFLGSAMLTGENTSPLSPTSATTRSHASRSKTVRSKAVARRYSTAYASPSATWSSL